MSTQEKIAELIPFVSENFITFPLAEEGDYRPTINIWKISKDKLDFNSLPFGNINDLPFLQKKYYVHFEFDTIESPNEIFKEYNFSEIKDYKEKFIYNFSIYNKDDVLENSNYNLNEMLDVALKLIKMF